MAQSTSRSRDGQLFTADLVISSAVFLLMVNLALLTWNVAYQNKTFMTEERTMRNEVVRATDLLVRTEGYPNSWNESTVRVVGVADTDHILDPRKLADLREIGYTRQKRVMRAEASDMYVTVTVNGSLVNASHPDAALGDQPVAYIAQENAAFTNTTLLQTLNQSDLNWSLYWPSTQNATLLDDLTAAHVYTHTTGGAQQFDDMLSNASGTYNTIIAEDVNVTADEIANDGLLDTFVQDGGTYLHTGRNASLVADTFGKETMPASGSGTVEAVAPLLNDSMDVAGAISFDATPAAFTNPITNYVTVDDGDGCLGCRWTYGRGEVFYLADTDHTSGSSIAFTDAGAFSHMFTLRYGTNPVDADTVAVNDRSVLVNTTGSDRYRRGRIKVIFWR